jgi:hypothetical protein
MRAWTNQLLNVSHLLILPVSLIFVIFGIAIVHYQDSQTQPIQPHLVSNYGTDKSGVELQKAYIVPTVANDYTGDNSQQLANNAAIAASPSKSVQTVHPASNNSSPIAIKAQPTTPQSSNSSPNQNNSLSSKLDIILSTIISSTKQDDN